MTKRENRPKNGPFIISCQGVFLMQKFSAGQRWISEMEPELGLGTVTRVEQRVIHIHFSGSFCLRQYAIENAPIRRVRFKSGDEIMSRNNERIRVKDVRETDGIITYYGKGIVLAENDLCDTLSYTTPKERFLAGLHAPCKLFNLRVKALEHRAAAKKSCASGFMGGRVELIPHQFYIAGEIAARYIPRVLLSDEVGLGKTIEAGLILHNLLLCERIGRVLIVVPESLVHQWFVELLRKFNLVYRIVDEALCRELEQAGEDPNPFLEDQLVICSSGFLGSDKRRHQVLGADWDMVVVDEAHHISGDKASYRLMAALAGKTHGLMLLTATPEQLGLRSHFDHLRLLDPARYHNFERFQQESANYNRAAAVIEKILDGRDPDSSEMRMVSDFLPGRFRPTGTETGALSSRDKLVESILDQHGTGRVVFRNTRASIGGFPGRHAHLNQLTAGRKAVSKLNRELLWDVNNEGLEPVYDFEHDPRIAWLVDFLKKIGPEKVLLICRTEARSEAVKQAVLKHISINIAIFNETMSIIRRDRNAAWFSEKNGAKMLVCSEIGSEGRNFQFASLLVLFDLPFNPELVEQRIGRLDRIGQKNKIEIHIPYIEGSAQEILALWYHQGLNLFENSITGLNHIYDRFGAKLKALVLKRVRAEGVRQSDLDEFLTDTRQYCREVALRLETGRDKLLEHNSFRPDPADALIDAIGSFGANCALDGIMLGLFKHYSIHAEEVGHRSYLLVFDNSSSSEFPLPVLRKNHIPVSFDRHTAVGREDMEFLTWDHPMVVGAMELYFGSGEGSSCLAAWSGTGIFEIFLEAVFVLECVAPAELHMDRFLPPTAVRVLVDHEMEDISSEYSFEFLADRLENQSSIWLSDNAEISRNLLPKMLDRCSQIAEGRAQSIIAKGADDIARVVGSEIFRLENLKKVNPSVTREEIELALDEMKTLKENIASARLRLDAIRLIRKE